MKTYIILILSILMALNVVISKELPRRVFFGANLQSISDSLKEDNKINDGLYLSNISSGSSAHLAGLKDGDILLSVDGKRLSAPGDLIQILKQHEVDDRITCLIFRDSEKKDLQLELKELPRETSDDFDIIYSSVMDNDDGIRRVIITKPKSQRKYPAVLLCGGLGCYSLDLPFSSNMAYKKILYELTKSGFVTVRVEKSGMGDSQGTPCSEVGFYNEVGGLVNSAKMMKDLDYIDPDNMIILGHSMGGLTGPLVAQAVDFKGMIAIATLGKSWYEYELTNTRRQLLLAGTPYDELEEQMELKALANFLYYKKDMSPEEIADEHPELAELVQYPAHHTFLQECEELNMSAEFKKLDEIKCLYIYGSSDFVTSKDEHEYAVEVINHYHPGSAEFKEIPELDHFFRKAESQSHSMSGNIKELFHDEALEVVIDWSKSLAK